MLIFIFNFFLHRCILEYLQDKIRVLVTHQLQFIEKATKILVLKAGNTLAYGTYEQITQNQDVDFVNLLKREENGEKDDQTIVKKQKLNDGLAAQKMENIEVQKQKLNCNEEEIVVEEETHKRGAVQSRVYWEYVRAGTGFLLLPFFIVVMIVSQSLYHSSDIFLTYWLV